MVMNMSMSEMAISLNMKLRKNPNNLERYQRFGFRPFLTNMQATVDIYGSQGE
ncbi:DUF3289 family protein [Advenella alkanexedens]|uniref:DUF3289 family protein n=1 Tax=Advenella alkanexedens TaxID=1481665 RepID=UPI003463C888